MGSIFKKTALAALVAFAVTVPGSGVFAEQTAGGLNNLQKDLETQKIQQADETISSSGEKAPAVAASEMTIENLQKLNKVLTTIVRYDSKISEPPKSTGSSIARYFRKLTRKLTIEDYMYEGYTEFQKGNFDAAYTNFKAVLAKDPFNDKAVYYMALTNMGAGKVNDATTLASKLADRMKDKAWSDIFKAQTDRWVEAEVAFKIGGFDSLEQYKQKIAAGNRKELHGDEYYEKFVNKKTWDYYSKDAKKEFDKIAGIDCGGFVQRVHMELCEKAGIKPPFNSKLPGDALTSSKYSKQIKDDGFIPPMSAKPGDFMTLSDHDGWGHVFYFAGRDKDGRPLIAEASGEGKVLARPMPDRYYGRYEGTYRFNETDRIRETLIAKSKI